MKTQLLYSYKCLPFCYLHICSSEWIKRQIYEGWMKHYRYVNTILQCSWYRIKKQKKPHTQRGKDHLRSRLLLIRDVMSSLLWNVQWHTHTHTQMHHACRFPHYTLHWYWHISWWYFGVIFVNIRFLVENIHLFLNPPAIYDKSVAISYSIMDWCISSTSHDNHKSNIQLAIRRRARASRTANTSSPLLL